MRTRIVALILSLACTPRFAVQAQEPLTPLWSHVDPYGAGSLLASYDVLSTRVAYDQGTDRIYRAIIEFSPGGPYRIQVFDTEGNDITPSPPVLLYGIDPGDYQVTHIIQLSVTNDTLSAIVRGEVYFNETDDLNWLKVMRTDGNPIYLFGCGSTPLNAFHRDMQGTLILAGDELRRYGPTGWPDGDISAPQTGGIAVLGDDVVLGVPPFLTHIDRSTMTTATSILVPSSASATTGVCLANLGSTFNYAATTSNGTMDLGLADINTGLIWARTILVPSGLVPTAYHVDENGDFWIAFVNHVTGVTDQGLLYRFHYSSGSYGVNSFSRRIDGIASSGTTLFLTGRVTGSTSDTYLAAFDIDLITDVPSTDVNALRIYPTPASTELRMDGLSPGTSRLTVTDVTGRFVKEMQGPFNGSMSIPVSDLPNGTYVLRSFGAGPTTMRSFSVLH